MSAFDPLVCSANRLVDSVLPWGGYFVPLVSAYFDESGTDDLSPVMSVAGYLFEAERGKLFANKWNAALADKGIGYFHMVDCAHGNEDFANLTLLERTTLAQTLIEMIKSFALRGVGAIMPTGIYDKLMPYHDNLGGAYNYCLWQCLHGVEKWREENNSGDDMAYFFESGHKSQSQANRIMHFTFSEKHNRTRFGYIAHSFVDKRRFPGVQAADILAWQMCVDWKHGRDGRPRRKDFAYLIDQKDHRVTLINADSILGHVREMTAMGAWD